MEYENFKEDVAKIKAPNIHKGSGYDTMKQEISRYLEEWSSLYKKYKGKLARYGNFDYCISAIQKAIMKIGKSEDLNYNYVGALETIEVYSNKMDSFSLEESHRTKLSNCIEVLDGYLDKTIAATEEKARLEKSRMKEVKQSEQHTQKVSTGIKQCISDVKVWQKKQEAMEKDFRKATAVAPAPDEILSLVKNLIVDFSKIVNDVCVAVNKSSKGLYKLSCAGVDISAHCDDMVVAANKIIGYKTYCDFLDDAAVFIGDLSYWHGRVQDIYKAYDLFPKDEYILSDTEPRLAFEASLPEYFRRGRYSKKMVETVYNRVKELCEEFGKAIDSLSIWCSDLKKKLPV